MFPVSQEIDLITEWSDGITVERIRSAFEYFARISSRLRDFDCQIEQPDGRRQFRFFEKTTGEQAFAFVTNSEWLLFSFLPTAIRSTAYSLHELQAAFAGARENERDEWVVRIRTAKDVDKLVRLIGWHYILDSNSMS